MMMDFSVLKNSRKRLFANEEQISEKQNRFLKIIECQHTTREAGEKPYTRIVFELDPPIVV